MAYQGRGSKTGAKIIAKDIKQKGGRAKAATGVVKTAAKVAAATYGPGKVAKAAKVVKKAATAKKAGSATPSKVVTSEGTFKVKKTKTGKTMLTDSKGNKYILKKGDTVQKLASREAGRRAEDYEAARAGFGYVEDIRPQFRTELRQSAKVKSRRSR